MNPGLSPIFYMPDNEGTNVPPAGNDPWIKPPTWRLAWHADEDPVPAYLNNQGNW